MNEKTITLADLKAPLMEDESCPQCKRYFHKFAAQDEGPCLCFKYHLPPHGFVSLDNNLGMDNLVVRAATCGKGSKDEEKLIRYMMRHKHTSPFEFVTFVFHVKLPIFVARQWMRHRMGTFNEISGRYQELPEEYWWPEDDGWRKQSESNRQGSSAETVPYEPIDFFKASLTAEDFAFQEYKNRLAAGISREQARSCLPLSVYTEFFWKVDLHNLLHFLSLRSDSHAQSEIRDYAETIERIIRKVVPKSYKAWLDYRKNAVTLSATEIQALTGKVVEFGSDREQREAAEKLARLGYTVYASERQVGDDAPLLPNEAKKEGAEG